MFTIYSKPGCTFCDQAKALLESKGLDHEVINLDVGQTKVEGATYVSRDELLARVPGARTMPQILQDGNLVGGYTELKKLLG